MFGLTGQGHPGGIITSPVITSLSVTSGDDWNTQAVTITGVGFLGATSATIGDVPIGSFVLVGPTSITGTVPARTLTATTEVCGAAVITPAYTIEKASAYTYTRTAWSYSGLIAWHRADKNLTLDATSCAWVSGGNASTISPVPTLAANATLPPTAAAEATFNNQTTAKWNSTDQGVSITGLTATGVVAYTAIVVGQAGAVGTFRYVHSMRDAGDNNFGLYAHNATNVATLTGSGTLSSGVTWDVPSVVVGVFAGGSNNTKIYHNALTVKAQGTITAPSGLSKYCLGSWAATPSSNLIQNTTTGYIAEACIFSRALTNTEIGEIITAMGVRYGITIGA